MALRNVFTQLPDFQTLRYAKVDPQFPWIEREQELALCLSKNVGLKPPVGSGCSIVNPVSDIAGHGIHVQGR